MDYYSDSDSSDDEMYGEGRNPKGEMTNKEIKEYLTSLGLTNFTSRWVREDLKNYLKLYGLSIMKDQRLPPNTAIHKVQKQKKVVKKVIKPKVKKVLKKVSSYNLYDSIPPKKIVKKVPIKEGKQEVESFNLDYNFDDKYEIPKREGAVGYDFLGHGASGIVVRGKNKKTGEEVAVKLFTKRISDSVFKDEVKMLEKVKNIKNVVHILDSYPDFQFQKNYKGAIVLDLAKGENVDDIMSDKNITQQQKILYAYVILNDMVPILEGLQKVNIINRDIKPSNMMLDRKTNKFTLLDFGLATEADSKDRFEEVGTDAYMAPEVHEGSGAYFESDIWSLGESIFQLVNGKHSRGDLSKSGDPVLDKIIYDMLAYDPLKRLTLQELKARLKERSKEFSKII